MVIGSIWRDTAGYLKYMDYDPDTTKIDSITGQRLTKIWILNHDYDSLGGGGTILARIPLENKKDTIITIDTLIDYVTTPILLSYWNGSEDIYFMADSIIRIDTIVTIDTLITKNILRLNYTTPLIVVDDSLTVQIPARIPLVYGKDTLIVIDTLINVDTLFNEYTNNFVTIIDTIFIPIDTLINVDTLVLMDTLKLNYKSPLAVVNDSLTLQLLVKTPLYISVDTVIKIDTLININDEEFFTTIDTLIVIDTLLVSKDTIKLLYKEPLYLDGDTLAVRLNNKMFAELPIVLFNDTIICNDTIVENDITAIINDTTINKNVIKLN
jgi:hypothetical protein